jgi:hypothetical protein
MGLPGVPTRFVAKCEFCPHELDTREPGSCQFTTGWVMNRSAGGGHSILLPKRENRWAHRMCIDRVIKGFIRQDSLIL